MIEWGRFLCLTKSQLFNTYWPKEKKNRQWIWPLSVSDDPQSENEAQWMQGEEGQDVSAQEGDLIIGTGEFWVRQLRMW